MTTVRPPTLAELARIISAMPDGPERDQLEGWYWAKVADRDGLRRMGWHRDDYQWLRAGKWRRTEEPE